MIEDRHQSTSTILDARIASCSPSIRSGRGQGKGDRPSQAQDLDGVTVREAIWPEAACSGSWSAAPADLICRIADVPPAK
jgi:hypothetical protein